MDSALTRKTHFIALLIGIVILVFSAKLALGIFRVALFYEETDGDVLQIEIERIETVTSDLDGGGDIAGAGRQIETKYRPRILYRYSVDGIGFTNDAYDRGVTARTRDWANSIIFKFRVRNSVTVYYDPKDPRKSALTTWITPFVVATLLVSLAARVALTYSASRSFVFTKK